MSAHDEAEARLAALESHLGEYMHVAVAVSGGVDSLTLAAAAALQLGARATLFHATSPAVPPEATERTQALAAANGWSLEVIDAGEFADPDYLRNPADRCFHCKANLYAAIARHTSSAIVSGTNTDDLGDYRPGLRAAADRGVRHPYVECGIDKVGVRRIARLLGLGAVAELAAAPCLSSRLETGIRVTPAALGLVHAVERLVADGLAADTVRCRIRENGVFVELDDGALKRAASAQALRAAVEALCAARGRPGAVEFTRYRMGSAFLRD